MGLGKIELSPERGHNFAKAIITPDTKPKEVAVQVDTGAKFAIAGVAKGAGMIHPDLAILYSAS